MRVRGSGLVPEAMITEPPACVTCRAAASLLRIPPVPSELLPAPARPSMSSSICGTSATSSGVVGLPGSVPIKAVDHAQDHQQRRLEQIGDHRGQPVVVAELDLVDTDRVVLVDDRHGIALEQCVQRVPHVEITGPAVEVFVGEEQLSRVAAMPAQAFVIGTDQVGLADGGGRLKLGQVIRPPFPAELAHARADRSRADERHLAAAVHHRADLLGQMVDAGRIERPVRTGQHAGPDLDDPGLGRQDDVVAHQVSRAGAMRSASSPAAASRQGTVRLGSLFSAKSAIPELQLR